MYHFFNLLPNDQKNQNESFFDLTAFFDLFKTQKILK